ncbi:MAG: M23 family metallopeptidase [Spirochaetes bacterium]|nr:M23 family metallopeptidase [Spirochaetota bacterium]
MGINPFKKTDLHSLLEQLKETSSVLASPLIKSASSIFNSLLRIGKDNITIMIIPHSEKKIINLHMSVFRISIIAIILILIAVAASVKIVDYNYITKDVSKLIQYEEGSDYQVKQYKEEINKLYSKFQMLKPEIDLLYALMFNNTDSLWAKGGESTALPEGIEAIKPYPDIEELNIKELKQELIILNKIMADIADSLKNKKIIETTPSIVPVKGYILTKSAVKISPLEYDDEFHKGIEIAAFPGSQIRAPAPGIVEDISWDQTFGLSVTLRHKYGFSSIFSHCQDVTVKINQDVTRGQTIAHVGRSGFARKHMCYYQIKIGTEFTDSFPFIYKAP